MNDTTLHHVSDGQYDVYIGRKHWKKFHWGSPFSHIPGKGLPSSSRASAVDAYRKWLSGEDHGWVEPGRRQWIIDNLKNLSGKRLGCHCHPLLCHGDVLIDLVKDNEIYM